MNSNSDIPDLPSQIGALEKQFKVFTIRGADGIGVHGSMKHGFVVSGEGGGGGGGGGGGTGEATGACCLPDNSCVVSTAAACGDAGGIYQGDAAPCSPNPCVVPVCPTFQVLCDHVVTSRAKCGYIPFHFFACTEPFTDFGYTNYREFLHGCSAEAFDCATSTSGAVDLFTFYLHRVTTFDGSTPPGSGSCIDNLETCGSFSFTSDYDDFTCEFTGGEQVGADLVHCFDSSPTITSHPVSLTDTLSNEYTTAMLIANTFADLPAFSGVFGFSFCLASRDLSDDESNFGIGAFMYKFSFLDFPHVAFTIEWDEIFTPEDGSAPVLSHMSEFIDIDQVESMAHLVDVPGIDGITTLDNYVQSCS